MHQTKKNYLTTHGIRKGGCISFANVQLRTRFRHITVLSNVSPVVFKCMTYFPVAPTTIQGCWLIVGSAKRELYVALHKFIRHQ